MLMQYCLVFKLFFWKRFMWVEF